MSEADGGGRNPDGPFEVASPIPLQEVVRRYLEWLLVVTGGHRARAADLAEVSERTIYNYVGRIKKK